MFPHFIYPFATMDDIFAHLLSLTSYIACQIIQFIENLALGVANRCLEDTRIGYHDHHLRVALDNRNVFEGSVSSSGLWDANGNNLGIYERNASDPNVQSLQSLLFVNNSYGYEYINFIFKGLMLPVYGLRFAWHLVLVHIRCTQDWISSVVSRVHRTLHGSSDDIGWLQHAPGMKPVVDGSSTFMELLCGIRNGEHMLPDSFVYLLIPGLFSNHGPLYFVSTKRFFSKMGLACHIAKIHSEASVEHNAWELKNYIEELYWGSGKRVMLLGHSKGGVDAAAALSIYSCDLKDKVAGLALVQSPYGGTPIASDILREGQIAEVETRTVMEFVICKLIKGDIRSLEDLTYEKRKDFITKHKLPDNIPLISFHSEASLAPGVITTLSHITHAELPWFPLPQSDEDLENTTTLMARKVPVMVPISGAMALCALHLQLRYGEKSDGVVTCRDAEVPGSVVVRPDRKLDHAWMVYSSWRKNTSEPDASEMCEALFTMLVQLGRQRQQ